jgi:K+-transporting ATPase ATPase C chain
MAFVTIIMFGVIYPLVMTAVAKAVFPKQANGSLIATQGKVIGSELIGQQFTQAGYFHPRPSAAGKGYDAAASGGSNLGPTSRTMVNSINSRVNDELHQAHGLSKKRIPADMVMASGSGLDPDISPANAYAQAAGIARARSLSESSVRSLINRNITGRTFGFLGEPRVNVVRINIALDKSGGKVE